MGESSHPRSSAGSALGPKLATEVQSGHHVAGGAIVERAQQTSGAFFLTRRAENEEADERGDEEVASGEQHRDRTGNDEAADDASGARRGELRLAPVAVAHPEQRREHVTAVEWRTGKEIEDAEDEVHDREPRGDRR